MQCNSGCCASAGCRQQLSQQPAAIAAPWLWVSCPCADCLHVVLTQVILQLPMLQLARPIVIVSASLLKRVGRRSHLQQGTAAWPSCVAHASCFTASQLAHSNVLPCAAAHVCAHVLQVDHPPSEYRGLGASVSTSAGMHPAAQKTKLCCVLPLYACVLQVDHSPSE